MNSPLPDVALTESSSTLVALKWVGMQGIDLPLLLEESGLAFNVHATADVQVDLPNPAIKGIHMSRLYRLLDRLSVSNALVPETLSTVLEAMVQSHTDCYSTKARVRLRFSLLCRRPALITKGLSGWKGYPVIIDATWCQGELQLHAQLDVGYSSTCPCSAALARQIIENAFNEAFEETSNPNRYEVAHWLRVHATTATPHSQRSIARVRVRIAPSAAQLGLVELIERIELALGTPLQTAVKRPDEQEFARLNGQNLMYVEDAAKRIQQALLPHYEQSEIFVSHGESLHPHDAVAWSSSMAR